MKWIVVSMLVACSSESPGGGGGDSDFGTEGAPCNADDECSSGLYCSVSGVCITEGSCAEDGDCSAEESCGESGVCLAEGTCAVDEDCLEGEICNEEQECIPGGECGLEVFPIQMVPPNLLLVLDRSCSMRRNLDNDLDPEGINKWTHSVDAITSLTNTFSGRVRWGLTLFPDTTETNCEQSDITVGVGPGTETDIQSLLGAARDIDDPNFPDGPCVTNIDTAMEQASLMAELDDPERKSFVALITDGKQAGCNEAGGDAGTETILANMHANGISTFVVGFGGATDAVQMGDFADAGGVPRAGDPSYYQADTPEDLTHALETIGQAAIGCSFPLGDIPPDPERLFVFLDGEPVPASSDDGWSFDEDANEVVLNGEACEALQEAAEIDIVLGCDEDDPA
ncbi:VWA domain-containing protein [Myxococcota bacterium]